MQTPGVTFYKLSLSRWGQTGTPVQKSQNFQYTPLRRVQVEDLSKCSFEYEPFYFITSVRDMLIVRMNVWLAQYMTVTMVTVYEDRNADSI